MTGTNNLVSKNSIIKNACRGSGVKFLKKNQHLNFFNFAVILGGRGGSRPNQQKTVFFCWRYILAWPLKQLFKIRKASVVYQYTKNIKVYSNNPECWVEGPVLHQLLIFFGAHISNLIICTENKICKVLDDFYVSKWLRPMLAFYIANMYI